MKKIISFLLTLIMLLGAVSAIPVSADTAPAVKAPEFYGIQHSEPTDNTQKIRIISTVDALDADKLGYEVTATFEKDGKLRQVVYSGEQYEGKEVYTTLLATNASGEYKEITAEAGKYFFALTITGVPTNIDKIFFDVKPYAVSGTEKIASDVTDFCYNDGAFDKSKLVYAENFDDGVPAEAATSAIATELGWFKGGSTALSALNYTDDGQIQFQGEWSYAGFVDQADMAGITKYSVEMDVQLSNFKSGSAAVFNLIFNDKNPADNFSSTTRDAMILSVRPCNDSGVLDKQNSDQLGVSLIGLKSGQNNFLGTDKYNVTDVLVGDKFTLRMDVDNTAKTIDVYMNGVLVFDYDASAYEAGKQMTTTTGPLIFWVQNCKANVDNVIVYGN